MSALVCRGHVAQLFGLAAAHEVARIGPLAAARNRGYGNGARGNGKLPEFLQILRIDGCAQPEAHEHRALTRAWALETFHRLRPNSPLSR